MSNRCRLCKRVYVRSFAIVLALLCQRTIWVALRCSLRIADICVVLSLNELEDHYPVAITIATRAAQDHFIEFCTDADSGRRNMIPIEDHGHPTYGRRICAHSVLLGEWSGDNWRNPPSNSDLVNADGDWFQIRLYWLSCLIIAVLIPVLCDIRLALSPPDGEEGGHGGT